MIGDMPIEPPDYGDEEYMGSGENYCWDCGGRGWKITCPDDLCHGQDECIHGDPPWTDRPAKEEF